MTALEMKQPGVIFRGTILFAQGTIHFILRTHSLIDEFINLFFLPSFDRSFRKLIFPGVPVESQVLPQICWISGGRGCENIHTLSGGISRVFS